ncbi:hypothetical protein, partial [Chryseobacterium scophthalmum]|uniref:hypothetical protein n=1 Tax=Chryseobacterium scophthalmum TaxID=59733 RepID=UPI003D07BED3
RKRNQKEVVWLGRMFGFGARTKGHRADSFYIIILYAVSLRTQQSRVKIYLNNLNCLTKT